MVMGGVCSVATPARTMAGVGNNRHCTEATLTFTPRAVVSSSSASLTNCWSSGIHSQTATAAEKTANANNTPSAPTTVTQRRVRVM